MSKKFIIITIFLSITGLVFQFLLTGLYWLFGWFFDLVLLGILMTVFSRLFRWSSLPFLRAILRNSLIFWSISGFLSIMVIIFSFWNNTYPWSLSKIVLSDGKRTIVFLEMSHVATPKFYEIIRNDIIALTKSGYIAYIEWVTPWKKENHDHFEKMLGIKFNSGTYVSMASALGMVAQDNSLFLGVEKGSIKNVDISIDDIVSLTSSWITLENNDTPIDLTSELEKISSSTEKPLFAYIMQAIMNFSLKNDTSHDLLSSANNISLGILSSGIDPELMDTILTKRNRYVVGEFLKGKDQKVIFLYGGLHFQWMYDLLKKDDLDWKILSIEPRYPYLP